MSATCPGLEFPSVHSVVFISSSSLARAVVGRNWTDLSEGSVFYKNRGLVMTIKHPTPLYDDSYAVNSESQGPYGDAITFELIPAVEKRFRAIAEPWARTVYGGSTGEMSASSSCHADSQRAFCHSSSLILFFSAFIYVCVCRSGGWESLAVQVLYPDDYNGCWSSCPDPITFEAFSTVNIYEESNAYVYDSFWKKTERPEQRDEAGNEIFPGSGLKETKRENNCVVLIVL